MTCMHGPPPDTAVIEAGWKICTVMRILGYYVCHDAYHHVRIGTIANLPFGILGMGIYAIPIKSPSQSKLLQF